MSTADGGGSDGGVVPKQYFCYQCNRTVSITPSPNSELVCPNCNGGFLEEFENSNPNPIIHTHNFFPLSAENLSSLSSFPSGVGGGTDSNDASALIGGRVNRFQSPEEFNPLAFFLNYLNTLRASGANIQFIVDNNNNSVDDLGFRIPINLGDYVVGPGLEQLIQQLSENDPNRYGTPPASKSAVEGLPTFKITNELLDCDSSQCAVCTDGFNLDEEAKQMPCKHIYHPDCIIPWLELHNSCPVCRYELPTDDPDYENRSRGGAQSSRGGITSGGETPAVGIGGSLENVYNPRMMDRRFRIHLPLLFRAGGEAINRGPRISETGNDNAGGPNTGGQAGENDLD